MKKATYSLGALLSDMDGIEKIQASEAEQAREAARAARLARSANRKKPRKGGIMDNIGDAFGAGMHRPQRKTKTRIASKYQAVAQYCGDGIKYTGKTIR